MLPTQVTLTGASLPTNRPPDTFTVGDRVRLRTSPEGPVQAYLVVYADEQIVTFAPVVEVIQ